MVKNIKVSPSNLDAFNNLLAGRYNETEQGVIDRINKLTSFTSDAIEKGKAFDHLTESNAFSLVKNRLTTFDPITERPVIKFNWWKFDLELCEKIFEQRAGAWHQQRVERIFNSSFGNVLLYGIVDDVFPLRNQDLKTTSNYSGEKFYDSAQWRIYLYCTGALEFDYLITDFTNIYWEHYLNGPQVTEWLEPNVKAFCEFVNDNKEKINPEFITYEPCG